MSQTRREFLRAGAVGAAAAGLASVPGAAVAEAASGRRRRAADAVPEARFGRKRAARGRGGLVVCSHPLATRAGTDVLRAGGNACDAALATSVAQTVVEPHMTTITGMLAMLYYDAASGRTTYTSGALRTPLAGLPGFNAGDIRTGRGAGVPGWWGGFEASLERHGSKTKAEICADAIRYAREGFEIHPFLYGEMLAQSAKIGMMEQGREIYMPDNALAPPGSVLVQERAADTLQRLVEEGNRYFYHGDFARRYSEVVQAHGGVITPEDFARYEVNRMEPARSTYRGYEVVASPPPDNGGTHIIEALNMIELLPLERWGPPTESPDTLYQLIRINNDVMEQGGKQRDPDQHYLPLETILSKEYARIRLDLLQMAPPKATALDSTYPGSNHVTAVDAAGNVATILHSSMALPWANGLFVEGVSIAASGGHFLRVMPSPGGRASAYIAPNIILREGRPVLASGSPSVSLIANILQNTLNVLDFGLDIETSVHVPRFGNAYGGLGNMVEADVAEGVRAEVAKRGVSLDVISPWHWMNGSFEGIVMDPATGTASACGDPRRTAWAEAV